MILHPNSLIFLLVLQFSLAKCSSKMSHEIELKSGRIRGKLFSIPDNGHVNAFLAIPYAQPPVGNLQFKKPVPVEPWENTLDCTMFAPSCAQMDEDGILPEFETSEDCLFLNVFSPLWKPPPELKSFPVLVFIHGGFFITGTSTIYGDENIATNLCSNDVIVVTINYRLGMFGFLATEDGEVKGNLALWDQTMALQWVRDNIEAFGGDPDNITVMGQSAGSVAVDLLTLSPHSRDLFHRAILLAGASYYNAAFRSVEEQVEICKNVAKNLGFDGSTSLLSWLSMQSTDLLTIPRVTKYHRPPPGELRLFQPVLDGDFLPKPLEELRKESPIKSIMVGCTHWEGLSYIYFNGYRTIDLPNQVRQLVRKDRYGEKWEEITEKIIDFYSNNASDEAEKAKGTMKFFSDNYITNGVIRLAQDHVARGDDVYIYDFDHFEPQDLGVMLGVFPYQGMSHGMDLTFIFGKSIISDFVPTENSDVRMMQIITTYITNFVKFGDPNGELVPKWEKLSLESPYRHLKMCRKPEMTDGFQEERAEFWRKNVYQFATENK